MKESFLFAGTGGQGIQTMGQILAQGAALQGYQVTFNSSYDSSMRGAPSNCTVIVSDSFIGNPAERHPNNMIAFSQTALEKLSPRLTVNGTIYYDESRIVIEDYLRKDVSYLGFPAYALAESIGNAQCANVLFLGFLCKNNLLFNQEIMEEAVRTAFVKKNDLIDKILEAFEVGSKYEKSC